MDGAMDELMISGKRFISTRRAAKDYHYHSDYIGQLIRSKKIVGQKVGHNWYVSAASVDSYMRKKGDVGQEETGDAKEKVVLEISETPKVSEDLETKEEKSTEITSEVVTEIIELPKEEKTKKAQVEAVPAERIYTDYKMLTYISSEEPAKEHKNEHTSVSKKEDTTKEKSDEVIPIKISIADAPHAPAVSAVHIAAMPESAHLRRSHNKKRVVVVAALFLLALIAVGIGFGASMVSSTTTYVSQ